MDKILEIERVTKFFGGLTALTDVSFSVTQGHIKSLIGPNGAGKTTLYNIVTGVDSPTEGAIRFLGERIDGLKPHVITEKGIARTFQNVELFENMSVIENVMLGRHTRTRTGVFGGALRLSAARKEEQDVLDRSMALLEFVHLKQRAHEDSAGLPFGLQRYLEIARALATEPKLLLLDEPASGLDPSESQNLCELILKIRDSGVTILLVEHNMEVAMEISDEIVVLNYGMKIAEGTPRQIQNNPEVISAYLGDDAYA
ncbi:MAG: ABC transporter ATP-binding protein [Deltaproteobacteria bacterium]|nr:ABC transporter ATP-binding protein [Deltaproteobacteria bacterium]MBW2073324.1 ABC transporter ATP-binding protein [Deltaproteobacteria bacterium]